MILLVRGERRRGTADDGGWAAGPRVGGCELGRSLDNGTGCGASLRWTAPSASLRAGEGGCPQMVRGAGWTGESPVPTRTLSIPVASRPMMMIPPVTIATTSKIAPETKLVARELLILPISDTPPINTTKN